MTPGRWRAAPRIAALSITNNELGSHAMRGGSRRSWRRRAPCDLSLKHRRRGMKQSEIMALQNEPACGHNNKAKSGCAKPQPGATQGGCSFDGAQIALLPICDVAAHRARPIGCAGSSWDARGSRSSGATLYRFGMTTDLSETDVIMGEGEKRLFHAIKQAVADHKPPRCSSTTPASRPDRRRSGGGLQSGGEALRTSGDPGRLRGLLWQQEPWQSHCGRNGVQTCHRHARTRPRTGKRRTAGRHHA